MELRPLALAKKMKISVVALSVLALALTLSSFAALNVDQNLASSGTITTSPNIGVYSDAGCTVNLTSICWGSVAAGGSVSQTVYVKNTGTGSMTLSLAASGWSPAGASTYITVSWNQQNAVLSAGQSVAAVVTVSVSSSITGISTFSNTITISGTG